MALYLLRPLIDIQAQLYAVSKDSALATDYLKDELKASTARKLVISDLRAAGDVANAQWLEDRWSAEADAANNLGGRTDEAESSHMVVGCLEYEHWLLGWYRAFHASVLPKDWIPTLLAVGDRFGSWAKATVGVPPPQPPDTTSLN